jgi:2-polyprenyl-3-methyl-5-hydroxy-6-metoxy-1,4-benzoquinol methylase
VCGPDASYRVRYAERIQEGPIDFRARKVPTHQHFRVVECGSCGLVYSNPIISAEVIEDFYRDTPFVTEVPLDDNMLVDYRRHLEQVLPLLPGRTRLLEIGCANGVFLKAALDLGFEGVYGVEPGLAAVQQAPAEIRPRIVNSLFSAELFDPASFDVVCCFQILDHFLDPVQLLRDVNTLLRDDGVVLLVNHNIRSWLPRLLGRRCPMYDIEHIYLWDPHTMARILDKTAFELLSIGDAATSYSLTHALRMFPLPWSIKKPTLDLCEKTGIGNWRVRVAAGNMVTVGRKKGAGSIAQTRAPAGTET